MKHLIVTVLFCMGLSSAIAQEVYSSSGRPLDSKRRTEEHTGFDPSRVIFGGGLAFGLGSGFLNVGVSPIIGYKISDNFAAGVGVGYNFLRIKNAYSILNPSSPTGTEVKDFSTSTYNANIWARYLVWNNIFVHVQPELNSRDTYSANDTLRTPGGSAYIVPRFERKIVASVLVGGGIRQQITDRVSFVPMVLYDVLQDPNSPYQGIDIRFGVNVGF